MATASTATTTAVSGSSPSFIQPYWTKDEHARFLEGLQRFGQSWESISTNLLRTRTPEQIKSYATLYFRYRKPDKEAEAASWHPAPVHMTALASTPASVTVQATEGKSLARTKSKDGIWTDAEHQLFLECWTKYGKCWKKISEVMKTRTNEQIRTHAQKYFAKLDQLRACGYDGDYVMDGTRHLTKTFLKKAQGEGRLGPGKWKPPKLTNPQGVAKRKGNRQAKKAVARLRGSSSRPRRVKSGMGGHCEVEEEVEKEGEGEGKGTGEADQGQDAGSIKFARSLRQQQAQSMAMDVDGRDTEEEDDRQHEAGRTVRAAAALMELTIDTGAGHGHVEEEEEEEGGLNDFDYAHVDGQHDAKQDMIVEAATATMTTDVPTPRSVVEALSDLITEWEQSDRESGVALAAPEEWVALDTSEEGNDASSHSTHNMPKEIPDSFGSSASTATRSSSGSSNSDGLTTPRDEMMMMMSSDDGTLLWESKDYHVEEDDENNSLTQPPKSPLSNVDLEHWPADDDFWQQAAEEEEAKKEEDTSVTGEHEI